MGSALESKRLALGVDGARRDHNCLAVGWAIDYTYFERGICPASKELEGLLGWDRDAGTLWYFHNYSIGCIAALTARRPGGRAGAFPWRVAGCRAPHCQTSIALGAISGYTRPVAGAGALT